MAKDRVAPIRDCPRPTLAPRKSAARPGVGDPERAAFFFT